MASPGFWDSQEKAQGVVTELKSLKALIKPLDEALAPLDALVTTLEQARAAVNERQWTCTAIMSCKRVNYFAIL